MSARDGGPAFGYVVSIRKEPIYDRDPSGEFPLQYRGDKQVIETTGGMSMLDHFAAAALQGLLSNTTHNAFTPTDYAADSYIYARAMLREREKQ